MAHPYHHSLSSVKKWGGTVADYQHIHDWFDASKAIIADFRHRALRHLPRHRAGGKPSRDFRITDAHRIGQGGLHEKARDNIAAIRLLKTLKRKTATPPTMKRPSSPATWAGAHAQRIRILPAAGVEKHGGGGEGTAHRRRSTNRRAPRHRTRISRRRRSSRPSGAACSVSAWARARRYWSRPWAWGTSSA
jgi:hypothetical protein